MFLRFALRRYNPARPLFAGNLFRFAKKETRRRAALAGREAVQEFHGAGVVAEYFFFLAKTT
jgi:hypothetical protein